MTELEIPSSQSIRQAVDGLAGYAYQLVLSAIEWAALPSGGTLLLEIAEDYAVLVGSVLTMTQAKNTSR